RSPASLAPRGFASMPPAAPESCSTNVADAAPRDRASIPPAPLPANRSRTRAPSSSGSAVAKRVCFTRSLSGLVPGPGARSRIPFADPAITRPASATALRPAGRVAGPDPLEPAPLELAEEGRRLRGAPGVGVERPLGVVAGALRERDVLAILERGDPQPRQPGLGEAQDVALAAQLEVLLGELEAVADLRDRLQPGLGRLVGRVRDEDAEALCRSAP